MCEKDMSTSETYYKTKLYPFQDGILDIVRRSGTPFYLTGGTALSRRWFGHRYSEDLDLFVDSDPRYAAHVSLDISAVRADLATVAEDILYGRRNSLCPSAV